MVEPLSELAISALRQKHAELSGVVIHHQREIERAREALSHIDAVLRFFAPDSAPETIRAKRYRPSRHEYFERGELRRRCREAMRDGVSITAESVVLDMMRDKGLDAEADQRLEANLVKRMLNTLGALYRIGRIEKVGEGRDARWRAI